MTGGWSVGQISPLAPLGRNDSKAHKWTARSQSACRLSASERNDRWALIHEGQHSFHVGLREGLLLAGREVLEVDDSLGHLIATDY